MNVTRFLERGITFAHQAGAGILSRIGPEIINLIAGGGRVESISTLQRPQDAVSQFYQRLVAAQNKDFVVISTDSPDLSRVLREIPKDIASKMYGERPIAYADSAVMGFPFNYSSIGQKPTDAFAMPIESGAQYSAGKVALINGEEAILRSLRATVGGRSYCIHSGVTHLYMPSEDALMYIVLHELYHAAAQDQYARHLSGAPLGEFVYGMAIDESLSDLYAILNYGSIDGSLDNGLACVRGFRANHLDDIGHDTLGILDYIIKNHDLTLAKAGSPEDLVRFVDDLRDSLDVWNNQELKACYALSVAERGVLSCRSSKGGEDHLPDYARTVASDLGVDISAINPDRRAQEILDDLVTFHAYSRTFQRERYRDIGGDPYMEFQGIAKQLGVNLPAEQRARIGQFAASPLGADRLSLRESDQLLFALDRYALLKSRFGAEPVLSVEQAPWVIVSSSEIGGVGLNSSWRPVEPQAAPAIPSASPVLETPFEPQMNRYPEPSL
ncbi:hypothetical protein [Geopseudomonas aromaticivorans]